ncbi:16S rRNA (guanine(966)-N(2))-methyltransferase RsmD [soil metagenome]
MRIVGGKYAGRDLLSPADARVRPTAELVRVGMIEMLKTDIKGAKILDLFAGTGALGLEAMSRGAKSADFVEFRPASLHALKANIATLRMLRQTRVFKRDAVPFAAALPTDAYDVAFLDPPYGSKMLDLILASWQRSGFARVLAVEHASSHAVPSGAQRREFNDTVVSVYRVAPLPIEVLPL